MKTHIVVRTYVRPSGESLPAYPFSDLLSETERQKAARFRLERDRWSYCAAHALLRSMLMEYHGKPALDWKFQVDPHGRPNLDTAEFPETRARFNLSHTEGLAVCALTTGRLPDGVEVGVDGECADRAVEALGLAERFLSNREAAWLRDLSEPARSRAFLGLWTLKEAVAKATGLGLGVDLKSFHCRLQPPAVIFEDSEWGPTEAWELHHWNLSTRHLVSLAVRRPAGVSVTVDFGPADPFPG